MQNHACCTDNRECPDNDKRVESPSPRRAILIGLVLVPINVIFLIYMELVTRSPMGWGAGPYPSTISLFGNAVLFLLALTMINAILQIHYFRFSLKHAELLIIYVMLMVSTAIAGSDFMGVLFGMITHPFRFATPENRWMNIICPHIPGWVSMCDPVALRHIYEGGDSLYNTTNLIPWIIPVAVWSAMILTLLWTMFCINTIVRRQWVENEKLVFPLVELPIQLADPSNRLQKNRLMWVGFGIAAFISIINGFHVLYPSIPVIPVQTMDISVYFNQKPWNAMGWTPVSFYPFAIGLGFLLPVDMLFSCWFFFLMWRVIRILGDAYGVTNNIPNFPYMNQQALGSYYYIAIFAIWSGRKHLRQVIKSAISGEPVIGENNGPMSYRTAFIGLFAGIIAVSIFFNLLHVEWWMAIIAVTIYFFLAMAIAKMHAEFGPPAHDLHFTGPEMVLTGVIGTQSISQSSLTGLNWFFWFNRAYRCIPIAYQLDGLKISQRTGIHAKHISVAIGLSSLVTVVGGFWIYLHFAYSHGLSATMANVPLYGEEAFSRLNNWITSPSKPDIKGILAIGWGMFFTGLLYFARIRFAGCPFHPLGFAISTSWSMATLWLPLLIAWIAKLLVMRAGGLRTYRIVVNFFLGLIIGDFTIGCLWPLIGWIFRFTAYSFTP